MGDPSTAVTTSATSAAEPTPANGSRQSVATSQKTPLPSREGSPGSPRPHSRPQMWAQGSASATTSMLGTHTRAGKRAITMHTLMTYQVDEAGLVASRGEMRWRKVRKNP